MFGEEEKGMGEKKVKEQKGFGGRKGVGRVADVC